MATLWWTKKEQLDPSQIALIEKLPLRESFLILGPPGSGKTNVLLRRAQFVRGQNMPNVLVLTFTRPLTEFVKTGCLDAQGREIFPQSCVTTLESWQRSLYAQHKASLPGSATSLTEYKRQLAVGAKEFRAQERIPRYDALFIDEAQDLLAEEVELIAQWSPALFFVGDDRQKIFENSEGLDAVRTVVSPKNERVLEFHYRVAPEICQVADRILLPPSGKSLASTEHYNGPKPATVTIQPQALDKDQQLEIAGQRLQQQVRVYADLIRQGDRLGVIVPRKDDRDLVFNYLETIPDLTVKSNIIRSMEDSNDSYDPSFDSDAPICILTVQGCKGLEFRAVHWLFADELSHHHKPEHYYTVVTRAKTSLDVCYTYELPQILARAHAETGVAEW
jgi:superfamily I DNA and RNA helicase